MADTVERERAYRGSELVTIIKGRIGRGTVEIRNAHGFIETVKGKELTAIDPREPESKLTFEKP
jgi:hypothetical protein